MIPDTTSNTDSNADGNAISNANSNSNTEASTRNAQTSTTTAVVLTETATATPTATSSIETSQQSQAQRKRQKVQNETTTVATTTPTVTVTTTQNSSNCNDSYDTIAPITTAATTAATASIQSGAVETNNTNVVTTVDVYFSLHIGDVLEDEYIVQVTIIKGTIIIDAIKRAILKTFESMLMGKNTGNLKVYSGMDNNVKLTGLTHWNADEHGGGDTEHPLIVKVQSITTTSIAATTTTTAAALTNTEADDAAKERGEAFIESIIKDYEDIPGSENKMKVLRNVVNLHSGRKGDVVLRAITEPFWNEVIIAASTLGKRVCAIGTPGVGKTTTTCILIRLLLQQNVTVVYNIRTLDNSECVYVFASSLVDKKREYTISVFSQEIVARTLKTYNNESTYYVVDPGKTKDNCNRPDSYIGKVIIVASPDEGHWGGSDFHKFTEYSTIYGVTRYFPVWELDELVVASSVLKPKGVIISEIEIRERFIMFGGVPRYVFASNFKAAKENLDNALADLSLQKHEELIESRKKNGMRTSNEDLPKGILLSYILPEEHKTTFEEGYATFCSNYVYQYVVDKYMADLWNKIVPNEGYFDPYLYETFTKKLFYDMTTPIPFRFSPQPCTKKRRMSKRFKVTIGGCACAAAVDDIVASAMETEKVLFYPISRKNKLIDFMFRDGNIYNMMQSTISSTHKAKPKDIFDHIMTICEKEEYSHLLEQTSIKISTKTLPKFNIYYVVPDFRYEVFTTSPVNPKQEALAFFTEDRKLSLLYTKWMDLVSVNVLCVSPPTPNTGKS